MTSNTGRGRWSSRFSRLRRGRSEAPTGIDEGTEPGPAQRGAERRGGPGWDHTARVGGELVAETPRPIPIRVQILSVLSDPRVDHITIEGCVRAIGRPRQDVETALDAMVQAGELVEVGGASRTFRLSVVEKERLEQMFREAATELGEHQMLAELNVGDDALVHPDDDGDEPRLPVTAGLLSLFLPGTGQLLNGDVGRASLVFAVWSLAWITQLPPVWTFVSLYAGAEAFFTAKIRGMERRLAKEALTGAGPPRALPPKSA